MHEKQQQRTASQLKRYSVHGGQAARGPEGQGAWQRRGRSPGLGHMGSAALLRFEVNVQSMQPGSIYYDLMRSLRERGDFGGSPGEPGEALISCLNCFSHNHSHMRDQLDCCAQQKHIKLKYEQEYFGSTIRTAGTLLV